MSTDAKDLTTEGVRYDGGKVRLDLLPFDGLEAVGDVFTYGANKYADRNWEKGMAWGRILGSLLRHTFKFWQGERIDPESGCHHMAHATWNALALLTYDIRKVGTDDRPNNTTRTSATRTDQPTMVDGNRKTTVRDYLPEHTGPGFEVGKPKITSAATTASAN